MINKVNKKPQLTLYIYSPKTTRFEQEGKGKLYQYLLNNFIIGNITIRIPEHDDQITVYELSQDVQWWQ